MKRDINLSTPKWYTKRIHRWNSENNFFEPLANPPSGLKLGDVILLKHVGLDSIFTLNYNPLIGATFHGTTAFNFHRAGELGVLNFP